MKTGYKVITKGQYEVLEARADFIDYMGECVHRGDTYWEMEVVSTNRAGFVVYDYVLIDPRWR